MRLRGLLCLCALFKACSSTPARRRTRSDPGPGRSTEADLSDLYSSTQYSHGRSRTGLLRGGAATLAEQPAFSSSLSPRLPRQLSGRQISRGEVTSHGISHGEGRSSQRPPSPWVPPPSPPASSRQQISRGEYIPYGISHGEGRSSQRPPSPWVPPPSPPASSPAPALAPPPSPSQHRVYNPSSPNVSGPSERRRRQETYPRLTPLRPPYSSPIEGGAYGRLLPNMEQILSAAIVQAMNDPEVLARNNPPGRMRSPMRRFDWEDDDNQETYPDPSWVWTDPQPAEPPGAGGINSRGAAIPNGGFCGFFRFRRHTQKINDVPASDSDSEDTCTICFERMKIIVMNPCGHEICAECNEKWSQTCPICREKITSTRRKSLKKDKATSKARIPWGKLKRTVCC